MVRAVSVHRLGLAGRSRTALSAVVLVALLGGAAPASSSHTVSGVGDLFVVARKGGPSRLVFSNGRWSVLDLSPDRRYFAASEAGNLFIAPIGGASAKKVAALGSIGVATWSPDGREIAFSNRGTAANPEPCGVAVWIVGRDGRHLRELSGCANYPAWSADSRRVAFLATAVGRRSVQLVVESKDGMKRQLLASFTPPTRIRPSVVWAPARNWLAYTSGAVDRVHVISADGRRRFDLGLGDALAWSRTGRLLFGRFKSNGSSSLYVARPDGRGRSRVARLGLPPAAWSPNGGSIAYVGATNRGRAAGIFTTDSAGHTTRVTRSPITLQIQHIFWSPTGRALFYVRERTED